MLKIDVVGDDGDEVQRVTDLIRKVSLGYFRSHHNHLIPVQARVVRCNCPISYQEWISRSIGGPHPVCEVHYG